MGSDLYYEITDLYTPKKKQENASESIKKPRVSRLSLLTKPQDTPPPPATDVYCHRLKWHGIVDLVPSSDYSK